MNPIPVARGGDSRRRPGRADPRRQRVGPRRRAVRDGRLGRRRRRHRLAEGVDGRAGPGDDRRLGARLGRDGDRPRCPASTSTSGATATRRRTARRRSRRRSPSSTRSTRASGSCTRRARPGSSPGTRRARRPRGPASRRSASSCSPTERFASRTVTAAKLPEGHDWKAFNGAIKAPRRRPRGRPGQAHRQDLPARATWARSRSRRSSARSRSSRRVSLEQGRRIDARRSGRRGVRGCSRRARRHRQRAAIEAGAGVPA